MSGLPTADFALIPDVYERLNFRYEDTGDFIQAGIHDFDISSRVLRETNFVATEANTV